MNFKKVRLSDVAKVISGSTPDTNRPEYWKGVIPWLTPADLNDGHNWYVFDTSRKITEDGLKSCSTQLLPQGTVLLTSRAPIGKVAIAGIPLCTNQGFKNLICDENQLHPEYLYYYLRGKKDFLNSLGRGATFKEISKAIVQNIEIPLPPLDEQKRIAAILDKADAVRRKRQETIRLLDEFLRSVFLEMFGDPVRNEKGWEGKRAIDYSNCIVPGRDKPRKFSGEIPWVTTDDLNHLGLTIKSKKNLGLTKNEIEQVRARIIPNGSVLITCVGDLGITSIAGSDIVVNQQLHAFQCNDDMDNVFFMYAISFQTLFMYRMASKTTVPYMNKTICNSIPMIKPPIELQKKFAQIVENTKKFRLLLEKSFLGMENSFNSMMQKAFQGEL
jgi:type I restriction enzyme S subunit